MTVKTPAWAVQIEEKIQRLDAKLDQLLDNLHNLSVAARAQAAPITHPTFCGYRCSWDIDDAGWPSYIHLEDGSLASHREKQGHHWYSVSLGDGKYGEHYLKFQRAAPPEGLLVMPSPAPSDTDREHDKEASLHQLHTVGRAVHGDQWRKVGPQLVHTYTNGRTDKSFEMEPAEVAALISALQKEA